MFHIRRKMKKGKMKSCLRRILYRTASGLRNGDDGDKAHEMWKCLVGGSLGRDHVVMMYVMSEDWTLRLRCCGQETR